MTDATATQLKARLSRTPYFEHPAHFDKNGNNTYYKNKNMAGENHVFLTLEDFAGESDVWFKPTQRFCFTFENNDNNRWNRQYVKTEEGRYYDINATWNLKEGERYRSSKIAQLFDFEEFCTYLSANKHDNVLEKLLTEEK